MSQKTLETPSVNVTWTHPPFRSRHKHQRFVARPLHTSPRTSRYYRNNNVFEQARKNEPVICCEPPGQSESRTRAARLRARDPACCELRGARQILPKPPDPPTRASECGVYFILWLFLVCGFVCANVWTFPAVPLYLGKATNMPIRLSYNIIKVREGRFILG